MQRDLVNKTRAVLLALQGALILLAAILVAWSGAEIFPLDVYVGASAPAAAAALGAAFIVTFRHPGRTWVNVAILYDGLAVVLWLFRSTGLFSGAFGGQNDTFFSVLVPALFLVALLVTYPRGEEAAA